MFLFYKAALSGEISTPLCSKYKSAWRKCGDDKEMLMRLALSQQAQPFVATHAYMQNGITKDYVKTQFKDYINGYTFMNCDGVDGYSYGLYVDWDKENDLVADKDVVGIMWTKEVNIIIPQTKCTTIYVSNRSNVHLVGDGYNSIRIYLFDESFINLDDFDEESSILVYKYSKDARVEIGKYCLGKVKVFDKELKI